MVMTAHILSYGLKQANNHPESVRLQDASLNSLANSVSTWESIPWRSIGIFKGVETFAKSVPGSKLHAMRGVTTLNVHISEAMAAFYDVTLAHEWIDTLYDIREYSYPVPETETKAAHADKLYAASRLREMQPLTDNFEYTDAVYEIMKLPWPIAPRDILLRREWLYDLQNKTVTVRYASIDDPVRCPETPQRIRAWSPHTLWRFHHMSPTETLVEIECLVDSKGSIPSWFINFMQRSFPSDSLSAFHALARKKKVPPHKRVQDW